MIIAKEGASSTQQQLEAYPVVQYSWQTLSQDGLLACTACIYHEKRRHLEQK